MTRTRAGGRDGDRIRPSWAARTLLVVLLALVGVACGDGGLSTTLPTSSASGSSPAASPGASGETGPKPTAWPGNAVLGIEALGAADGPILSAINDFNRGIQTQDLALMRRAADGLAGLDVLLPNMAKIEIFEPMRPFAEKYAAAINRIVAAAKAVRGAIDAGDAAAITTTSQALIESFGAYTAVQPELATWVAESIKQRRLLLR